PRYNLVARMQITSDNVHGSAPFPAILGRDKPSLPDLEPMPLSNQTCFLGPRLFTPVDDHVHDPAQLRSVFAGLTLCGYTGTSMTVIVKSKTPFAVPDQARRRAGFKPGKTY
ncbi:MAG TPA: hypothetical protein VKO18_13825, partial [Terriglobia bacterium]|nr:hypothetical protein [Terriglobia bacterium]